MGLQRSTEDWELSEGTRNRYCARPRAPCCGGRMTIIETFERGCNTAISPDRSNPDRQIMIAIARSRRPNADHSCRLCSIAASSFAEDQSCAPDHIPDGNRDWFNAPAFPATAISPSGIPPAVTTRTHQPTIGGPQIHNSSATPPYQCRPAVSSPEAYQTPALRG